MVWLSVCICVPLSLSLTFASHYRVNLWMFIPKNVAKENNSSTLLISYRMCPIICCHSTVNISNKFQTVLFIISKCSSPPLNKNEREKEIALAYHLFRLWQTFEMYITEPLGSVFGWWCEAIRSRTFSTFLDEKRALKTDDETFTIKMLWKFFNDEATLNGTVHDYRGGNEIGVGNWGHQ